MGRGIILDKLAICAPSVAFHILQKRLFHSIQDETTAAIGPSGGDGEGIDRSGESAVQLRPRGEHV